MGQPKTVTRIDFLAEHKGGQKTQQGTLGLIGVARWPMEPISHHQTTTKKTNPRMSGVLFFGRTEQTPELPRGIQWGNDGAGKHNGVPQNFTKDTPNPRCPFWVKRRGKSWPGKRGLMFRPHMFFSFSFCRVSFCFSRWLSGQTVLLAAGSAIFKMSPKGPPKSWAGQLV